MVIDGSKDGAKSGRFQCGGVRVPDVDPGFEQVVGGNGAGFNWDRTAGFGPFELGLTEIRRRKLAGKRKESRVPNDTGPSILATCTSESLIFRSTVRHRGGFVESRMGSTPHIPRPVPSIFSCRWVVCQHNRLGVIMRKRIDRCAGEGRLFKCRRDVRVSHLLPVLAIMLVIVYFTTDGFKTFCQRLVTTGQTDSPTEGSVSTSAGFSGLRLGN
jgi:hypothetical protein